MFVEVLVVGIGSLVALVGFISAAVGHEAMKQAAPVLVSTPVSGAALAFSYALGIVMDRGADYVLKRPRRNLRRLHFQSDEIYDQARRSIAENPHIVAMADYARSRMRICRGWFVNCLFLAAAGDLMLWRFPVQNRALVVTATTVLGLLLAWSFYAAWRNITATGYKKLAQQARVSIPDLLNQVGAGAAGQ